MVATTRSVTVAPAPLADPLVIVSKQLGVLAHRLVRRVFGDCARRDNILKSRPLRYALSSH
jgi:hypothetical protein